MAYKDKAKQREANRQAQARFKAKSKGITKQGITEPEVIPEQQSEVIPKPDLEKCRYCGADLPKLESPRRFPGACYPCTVKPHTKPKEVGNIKVFEDLPPDVQKSIETMSQFADNPSEDKARRTARAIHYQHLFPGRFHSTGM